MKWGSTRRGTQAICNHSWLLIINIKAPGEVNLFPDRDVLIITTLRGSIFQLFKEFQRLIINVYTKIRHRQVISMATKIKRLKFYV